MTSVTFTCIGGMLLAVAVKSAAPLAAPQPPAAAPVPMAQAAPSAPAQPATAPGRGTVEPQGYTYEPEGRRDPFVSLLKRGTDARTGTNARPPGLSGLGVGEVTLKGTMQSRTGYVGLLRGADNKTYIVKPGDKLADGTIRTITADEMVIVQQVNDPLSLEKQREVRKALRQTDEVK